MGGCRFAAAVLIWYFVLPFFLVFHHYTGITVILCEGFRVAVRFSKDHHSRVTKGIRSDFRYRSGNIYLRSPGISAKASDSMVVSAAGSNS